MRFVDAETVHRHLDLAALTEGLHRYHCAPPPAVDRLLMQQAAPSGETDNLLIWPAWQNGEALGMKLVTLFPDNPSRNEGLPAVQAVYVLFDGTNGSPLACMDGTALTYRKTAADSALGARHLAREDAASLVVVGAGAMSPWMVRAMTAIRPTIGKVRIWNRTPEKAEAIAGLDWPEQLDVAVAGDLEAAVREADIVSCVTGSLDPIVFGEWLKPGMHLDLVGAYRPDMREADDEAARRARIHVDSRWFTIGANGDIDGPIASGAITEAGVLADLFELCQGTAGGRTGPDDITMFKNAGGAHLDLMTARFLWERLAA